MPAVGEGGGQRAWAASWEPRGEAKQAREPGGEDTPQGLPEEVVGAPGRIFVKGEAGPPQGLPGRVNCRAWAQRHRPLWEPAVSGPALLWCLGPGASLGLRGLRCVSPAWPGADLTCHRGGAFCLRGSQATAVSTLGVSCLLGAGGAPAHRGAPLGLASALASLPAASQGSGLLLSETEPRPGWPTVCPPGSSHWASPTTATRTLPPSLQSNRGICAFACTVPSLDACPCVCSALLLFSPSCGQASCPGSLPVWRSSQACHLAQATWVTLSVYGLRRDPSTQCCGCPVRHVQAWPGVLAGRWVGWCSLARSPPAWQGWVSARSRPLAACPVEQPCGDAMSTAVCLVVPWQAPQGLDSGHHLSTVPAPLLVQLCSFLVVRAPWARMPGLEGLGAQRRAALESRAEGPWALHAHRDEGGQDPRDPWSRVSSLLSGHRAGSTRAAPATG